MANISNTVIVIVSTDSEYKIPGDFSPEQIVANYAASIPGIGNMVAEVTVDGNEKTVTFKPRTGSKGSVTTTFITIVSTDSEYRIPGDFSPEQVVANYAASIPGIGNMVAEVTVAGDEKTITFKPRTGSKGAVSETFIVIVSTDSEYKIPGDFSPEQIVANYAASIPGIGNMVAEVEVDGDVKTVTFKPRTGSKGLTA